MAGEIRKKIEDAGILANRTADSIITKIYELVSSYKQAHHIKNQSGETMENVYAACKYFDVLDPILGSRPSIQPRLTNKTARAEKESDADNNLHSPNQKTAATVEVEKKATTATVEKKKMRKSIVTSVAKAKKSGKQDEYDVLKMHLENQSNVLKLQEKKFKLKLKNDEKKLEKAERDRIFDILKQRKKLKKMGVSQRYIDKYFSVSPQQNGENGDSDSDSSLSDALSK